MCCLRTYISTTQCQKGVPLYLCVTIHYKSRNEWHLNEHASVSSLTGYELLLQLTFNACWLTDAYARGACLLTAGQSVQFFVEEVWAVLLSCCWCCSFRLNVTSMLLIPRWNVCGGEPRGLAAHKHTSQMSVVFALRDNQGARVSRYSLASGF